MLTSELRLHTRIKHLIMKKAPVFVVLVLLFCTVAYPQKTSIAGKANTQTSLLNIDYRELVSHADLIYDKPVARSEEGHPIGNGRMGSLVWTIPSSLKFQINRVDVFANNATSNNFYERHTDYCGGVGFVDIDFGEEIFTAPGFRQQLSCYDGVETVHGNGIKASVLAWNKEDVMAINIIDERKSASPIMTDLRILRMPLAKTGNHTATSKISIVGDKIVLTQEFKEDNYYCGSAVVIGMTGRKGRAEITNDQTVRLVALAGDASFNIYIASAASFNPKENIVDAAIKKLDLARSADFSGLLQSNKNWWQSFWQKAFVRLSSADGEANLVEKHYTYYLYVMASSSRGDYPTKFNGMLWTTGGDARKWGALYWGANQSCLYTALFPTNRWELLDPMFNMYTKAYDSYAEAATKQWGSKGIFIPEVTSFDGTPVSVPEDIAAEMRELYILKKPWQQRSQKFIDYTHTKLPFMSIWNWKKDDGWKDGRWQTSDKGGGVFGHTSHIFSRGAKIAYQYWLKYEYIRDEQWLRKEVYPMLKGVAEFYRNYPTVKKEKDGKYHIYHVNDNESVWGGHNTIEEISSMRGIFPVLIKASEILKLDAELRPVWKEFLENLSPLPVNRDYAGSSRPTDTVRWIRSLPPIVQGEGNRRPDGNTMPVWFFDLCTLESDAQTLKIANATYDGYFRNGISRQTNMFVLSKLASAGTSLGRVEATKYLIPNQIRTAEVEVMPNRMDGREGFQTTSIQRLGRAAEALHYALCQSVPSAPGKESVIRVFPAWPKDWDAQFSLVARGNFMVTSSMKKGNIEFVEITSQAGGECVLRNPWSTQQISIYKNGKKMKDANGDLLRLQTNLNDKLLIVPKGFDVKQQ